MRVTLATDARSPVALSRAHRRTLAELVAGAITAVELPATYDEESEPAPCVEGQPDYEPAPFHAWARVPYASCWELEWAVPALEVELGTVAAVDGVALARIGWECADAHEIYDEFAFAWDDEFECAFEPAVVDDGDATRVEHPEFAVTVRATSVEIVLDDDSDVSQRLPADLEFVLVELVCDLTGFRLAGFSDWDGEADLRTAVRFESACRACWPERGEELPAGESARRLADALTASGAVALAPGAHAATLVAAAERALARPDAPSLARAERLAAELLACAEVEEVFADDASLAAWLEGW